ncbi:MAG: FHA domain-containing protein [Planctomycetota bacterium]
MSFRLFIYYCALMGAWTGIVGWAVGRLAADAIVSEDDLILNIGLRGLFLGAMVTLGLSVVDALWNVGWRNVRVFAARVITAVALGALGGFLGGGLAQWLIGQFGNQWPIVGFFVLGWTLAGLIMGASVAAFEWILSRIRQRNRRAATAKLLRCTLGGGLGGLIGALASYMLREGWIVLFESKDPALLWSPNALGLVTFGLFVGLLVGLTQVALKPAWIRIEAGFRPGRELILSKDTTKIGRSETADIGLFGDPLIDPTHAQILHEGPTYFVEDASPAASTFVNDRKIRGRTPLASGDLIRIGKSVLRFSLR